MSANRRSSAKFKGPLSHEQSDFEESQKGSTETQSNTTSETQTAANTGPAIDYDDTDDQLLDSSWKNSWQWFIHDFLHDRSALWLMAIHFLVFFICMFFGPMTLPLHHSTSNSMRAVLSKKTEQGPEAVNDIVNLDLSHLKIIRNAVFFMLATIFIYTISLLVVLIVRYILIKLVVQPLYNISRLAIVITYAIDPAAAYCIWGIINYGIFRKFTKPANDAPGHHFHRFVLFGRRASKYLEVDHRCYTWANSACHLQILVAARRLLLSSLLFLFEVSFLPNYSPELKCFLNNQALLRKFNMAWLNYVNKARMSDDPLIMDHVEDARVAVEKLPMPETPIIIDHQIYYSPDNFQIFRPMIHKWRRTSQSICDMNQKMSQLPQFCKEYWIRQCSRNYLTNWSALHYMVHHPPELLFMDYYVPLVTKYTVQDYSRLLFDHMYETMTALNQGRVRYSMRKRVAMQADLRNQRSMQIHLEAPIHSIVTKYSGRFSAEPLTARSKSSIHVSHMPSSALYMESSDEAEMEQAPPTYKRSSHLNMDENRKLTPKMFAGLNSPIVEAFFAEYDIGNCGYITASVFMRNVLYMCSMRKRLLSTLKNQRSILCLVGRILSTVLWFFIFVMFLMTSRVDKNILLPSTIGFLSAMIVALSYMYTSFITAIIFVVLSNPYNVGDRIRINNGEAMFVQAITTYSTTFRCIHGKIIVYQNAVLSTVQITNETRARHAAHEIAFRVGASTTPAALKKLSENLKSYVNGQPRKFVKDGCYIYKSEVQVGHYYLIRVLLTYLDNWQIASQIFLMRNEFLLQLAKQCKMLGITYKEAVEPISFCGVLNYGERKNKVPTTEMPPKLKKN